MGWEEHQCAKRAPGILLGLNTPKQWDPKHHPRITRLGDHNMGAVMWSKAQTDWTLPDGVSFGMDSTLEQDFGFLV